MGIVETDLAEFELSELSPCRIEQDVSGVIHLHLGSFRLELTVEEFDHFVTVVDRGRTELHELKTDGEMQSQDEGDRAREPRRSTEGTDLTDEQRGALLDTFEALNDFEIPYVVLRGYEDMPDSIEGSDVDLLVDADRFDDAVRVIRDRFDPAESRLQNVVDIVRYGSQNPLLGARTLVESPDMVASYLQRKFVSTEMGSRNYIERTFEHDGLVVHMVNHLAYTSPMNGARIRVSPEIEDGLLEHRVDHGPFTVPAPSDELAHLVCRGVFDYGGTFPDRYEVRCDELREDVFGIPRSEESFSALLSHLFYSAAPLVTNLVREGEYDSIRPRLISYDSY